MKVLQVNAVYGAGSTGRLVSELAAGLEHRGIQSRVAYAIGAQTDLGFIIGGKAERVVHALGSRITGKQAYFSRQGTRSLLRYIDEESPDVVHLHNLHSNYIHLPMLLSYLAERDIATVLTLHDCWFFTGKCVYYTSDGCERWKTGCGSCPRLHKDNPSWGVDATASMWADKLRLFRRIPRLAVVGVSDWITGQAEQSLLAGACSIRRIYNWVDLETFRPCEGGGVRDRLGMRDAFVILGVASKWSDPGGTADKGLAEFVALAKLLETKAGITQASGGSADLFRPMIVLVGELGSRRTLPSGVQCVGATNNPAELAEYYVAADVFLQLSREETFGMVTAEALACGTPAIVYESTANPELIGEGCGHVVKAGDLSQVLSSIRAVRAAPRLSAAASCRAFACENFSMEDQISSYVSVYRDLCRHDCLTP